VNVLHQQKKSHAIVADNPDTLAETARMRLLAVVIHTLAEVVNVNQEVVVVVMVLSATNVARPATLHETVTKVEMAVTAVEEVVIAVEEVVAVTVAEEVVVVAVINRVVKLVIRAVDTDICHETAHKVKSATTVVKSDTYLAIALVSKIVFVTSANNRDMS